MILEHAYRDNPTVGVDACTYTYHQTPCGKPRIEHMQSRRKHLWGSVVRRVHNVPTPVLACTRPMCFTSWWPTRNEPTSECKGL